jgi:hypothetical protein
MLYRLSGIQTHNVSDEDTIGVIRICKIQEGQTTQWLREKGQIDKQPSTKQGTI